MKSVADFIRSGVLEMYVFGLASELEIREVEDMAAKHREVGAAVEALNNELEHYTEINAINPPAVIKPMVMATINYLDRVEKGEQPSFPPMLCETSQICNYEEWLKQPGFTLPPDFADLYARIIAYTPQAFTAVVWIQHTAPAEVHDNEFERFLILEGTCDIIVEETKNSLKPGDYFSIPLLKSHQVRVTSAIPCKAILQRVAA